MNPDNLTFDPKGRMFVATDGANDFDLPDGIYGIDTEGPARGLPKLLFTCPHGAEATGPCFTPDGTTLFVSVQHPAEDAETLDKVETRWPDFKGNNIPRPGGGGHPAHGRQGSRRVSNKLCVAFGGPALQRRAFLFAPYGATIFVGISIRENSALSQLTSGLVGLNMPSGLSLNSQACRS